MRSVTPDGPARRCSRQTIAEAKAGHQLTPITFSLLYAADFADRLEHEILPALQAGFVVIADRYMYTAFARNAVMGADPEWTHEVFGMALVPDLVLYLEIDVDTLVPRVVRGKGMDYWESGLHLALSSDIFDSFQNYQRRIIAEYNRLAREFGFITIDARESINKIQTELRAHVSEYLRRAQDGLPRRQSRATLAPKKAERSVRRCPPSAVQRVHTPPRHRRPIPPSRRQRKR